MSYTEVLQKYDKTNHRVLMMKLSIKNSFEKLVGMLDEWPVTSAVRSLFSDMKGDWEVKCGRGSRVYDEKVYFNAMCKDAAVLFAIRVLGSDFTYADKRHMYNCYRFIQSHPHVFGDRIRHHVKEVVFRKLTSKQQSRESKFELNICDNDESDTESSESEPERCDNCENPSYACDC